MSEESPNFRLVTDNAAFLQKRREPVADVPAKEAGPMTADCTAFRLAGAEQETKHTESRDAFQPRRTCAQCGKDWPDNMLFKTARGSGKQKTEVLLCAACQRRGERGVVAGSKNYGSSFRFNSAGWVFAALAIGIVVTLAFTWKYLGSRGAGDAEWITEEWAKEGPDKWPVLALRSAAPVKHTGLTMSGGGFLLKKRSGAIHPIAVVTSSRLAQSSVQAATFAEITAQLGPITLTAPGSGARPLTFATFPNPNARPDDSLWVFPATPDEKLPGTPLEVRRQSVTTGIVGHLVATGGSPVRQEYRSAHIIQGIADSDEYTLLLDAPMPPELVPGSLFIDKFGHLIGIGEEAPAVATGRHHVIIRNVLTLRRLSRE